MNSSGSGVVEVTLGILQGRLDSMTVGVLDVLNGPAAEDDDALGLGDGGLIGAWEDGLGTSLHGGDEVMRRHRCGRWW